MAVNRVITVDQLMKQKFDTIQFEGAFRQSFGRPEKNGVWMIWGHSGNGKTTFALQMAKELTKYGKVAYNTLEEGARKSMQEAVLGVDMQSASMRNFVIINRETITELRNRLSRRQAPNIVFIDSFQYAELNKIQVMQLTKDFPKVLFIFISHAEGRHPEGRAAKAVRYHADVKIRIEGYKAFAVSRSRETKNKPYMIWEEGAKNYWGEN